MTLLLGNLALGATVLGAVCTLLVSLRAVRVGSQSLSRAACRGVHALTLLLIAASLCLLAGLLTSDFRLEYVQHYTERALPFGYKLAAFWAGQQGSLLLWALMLAGMSSLFVFLHRKQAKPDTTIAAGTLAIVVGFFAALMLFAANPFQTAEEVAADGHGLNPMLQDPGMIIHPPILFLGYAGFTIPFALLLGALVTKRFDKEWLADARPWVLVSWLFLGGGILLGANWAYTVLGWGGYWAWDPVENASLLPWLTATALLHSLIGQRQRGMFKRWTATLTAGTFLLCILGTYITRSGVVDSVHTFGHSWVGTFFGVFLTVTTLITITLLALRWGALKPERPLDHLVSREGAFFAGNILFLVMTGITLVGTLFPALTRMFTGEPMSVKTSFYNKGVLPLALALLALMAVAPLLSYGSQTMKKIFRGLVVPLVAAAVAVATLWSFNVRSAWAIACAVVCVVLASTILIDLVISVRARRHNTHENVLVAFAKLFDANHRRYGSHVVHAGIVMIVAGIAGSSLYSNKQTIQLAPGGSTTVGRYDLKLEELQEVRGSNYSAVRGVVTVAEPSGRTITLHPQRRFFDKAEEANTQVALQSNWSEDLYVMLAGWEENGSLATFQVIVNPLVRWIWAGGVILALGGIWCVVPRIGGRKKIAAEPVTPAAERRPVTRRQKKARHRAMAAAH